MSSPPDWPARARRRIEAYLPQVLPAARQFPQPLHQAMRYSVLGGGKRLRPLLCLAAAQALAGSLPAAALPAAAALELIHSYSLIHDDLPAMDDDRLRRGRPTCHVVYGEALAILAGDGLQACAFELLANIRPAELSRALSAELAAAAGAPAGMVAGQAADILAASPTQSGSTRPLPAARLLEAIHRRKTGALLRAACVMGGLTAQASRAQLRSLRGLGDEVGLAFQIKDDLLDLHASTPQLGKTAGKDLAQGKLTYPGLYGPAAAQAQLDQLSHSALRRLRRWGAAAQPLRDLIAAMARREH